MRQLFGSCKLRTWATLTGCVCVFTGLGAQSSKATTKNQASCSKFVVIGSRGSGAGPNSPDWGGGFGLPGQSFANDFKKLVGTERVKTQYNTYEAVGILPTLDEIFGALRISPASIAGYIKAIRQALNGPSVLWLGKARSAPITPPW